MNVEEILLTNSSIKTEEIEIKPEPTEGDPFSEIIQDIKKEEDEEWDAPLHFKNDLVDIEEIKALYGHDHLEQTSAASTSANYGSYQCTAGPETQANESSGSDIKTERRYSRKNQRKPSSVQSLREGRRVKQMYQCDKCKYKTKHEEAFKQHLLKHNPTEVRMYECDVCKYTTKRKSKLQLHCLRHKNPWEVQMYVCDKCDYKSIRKDGLKRHELVHKNPAQVHMYACHECQFVTKRKESLRQHRLRHMDPSEKKMHHCEVCKFTTDHKSNLQVHLLRHKDISEVNMYMCEKCGYRTKYKGDLNKHERYCARANLKLTVR